MSKKTLIPGHSYEFAFPGLRDQHGLPVGGKLDLRVVTAPDGEVAVMDIYRTDGAVLVRAPEEQPPSPWRGAEPVLDDVVQLALAAFWRAAHAQAPGVAPSPAPQSFLAAARAAVQAWLQPPPPGPAVQPSPADPGVPLFLHSFVFCREQRVSLEVTAPDREDAERQAWAALAHVDLSSPSDESDDDGELELRDVEPIPPSG